MVHNGYCPKIDVDPETYEVRADGELLECEPANELPFSSTILSVLGMEEFVDLISQTMATAEVKNSGTVYLPFAKREKARFKASLDTGEKLE